MVVEWVAQEHRRELFITEREKGLLEERKVEDCVPRDLK